MTFLSLFFGFGALISGTTLVALATPGGFLEPLWRLNPRAHEQFASLGYWSWALMAVVSVACLAAAMGLWRGRRFGYLLGVALLTFSMLGDLANAVLGLEPRAWMGVPIAGLFLALLLTGRARAFFRRPPQPASACPPRRGQPE